MTRNGRVFAPFLEDKTRMNFTVLFDETGLALTTARYTWHSIQRNQLGHLFIIFIHVLHVVAPTHALYKSLNISFSKPTWQHQVSEFARGTLSRTLTRMKSLGCLMFFKFYVHTKPIITSVVQPPGKGLLTTHWPLSSSQHILRYHVFAWHHPFKKGDRMAMSLICLMISWWFI